MPLLDTDLQPLPLPPLHSRADLAHGSASPFRPPWHLRAIDSFGKLLPLILMGALALASTWLLRQSNQAEPQDRDTPARHVPDYEMRGFSIQRHVAAGLMPSVVEGDVVRHYTDTDTLEIDGVRVRWLEATGQVTTIKAQRAVLYEKRNEVVLEGQARLERPALGADHPSLEFSGEQLIVDTENQTVRADRPVVLQLGGDVFDSATLRYDHRAGQLVLSGAVRGRIR